MYFCISGNLNTLPAVNNISRNLLSFMLWISFGLAAFPGLSRFLAGMSGLLKSVVLSEVFNFYVPAGVCTLCLSVGHFRMSFEGTA